MPVSININGVITAAQDTKISVFDHGLLFGDSVYETLLIAPPALIYSEGVLTRCS